MTPALELLYASQDLSSEQTEELFTKIFNGEPGRLCIHSDCPQNEG